MGQETEARLLDKEAGLRTKGNIQREAASKWLSEGGAKVMNREERRFEMKPLTVSRIPASLVKRICSTKRGREAEAVKEPERNSNTAHMSAKDQ